MSTPSCWSSGVALMTASLLVTALDTRQPALLCKPSFLGGSSASQALRCQLNSHNQTGTAPCFPGQFCARGGGGKQAREVVFGSKGIGVAIYGRSGTRGASVGMLHLMLVRVQYKWSPSPAALAAYWKRLLYTLQFVPSASHLGMGGNSRRVSSCCRTWF
ncbi:hypothetical protein B0H11DRAFT_1990344 [Mycena galericulata]|nr:hypothetical protein B0H11DRAFT_1990344 [Mycena galericulata]